MNSRVEIKLDRVDVVYRENEVIKGKVCIWTHHKEMAHNGIELFGEGSTRLQVSAKNVGLFEAFYNAIEPLLLFREKVIVAPGGKVKSGMTEFPFELKLKALNQQGVLYETYHGVYINTIYELSVEVSRGMLSSNLTAKIEFVVEAPTKETMDKKMVAFVVTPETLENVNQATLSQIPRFKISGKFYRTNCPITEPLAGELVIEQSDAEIASIELQLVRVETVAYTEGYFREATEIQNLQLGDGDVCRGLVIPMYAVFPRFYACPTMLTSSFKVEFEVNLTVLFRDGYMVTENFPIQLFRS